MTEQQTQKMQEKKFTRTSYSFATKIELLDLYHSNRQKFNSLPQIKQIHPTTFSLWLRTESWIKEKARGVDISVVKRSRHSSLDLMDQELYRWFVDARTTESRRRITDDELVIRTNEILDNLVDSGLVPTRKLSDLLQNLPDAPGPPPPTRTSHVQPSTSDESTRTIDDEATDGSIIELMQYPYELYCYRGITNCWSDCYLIVILQLLFFHRQFRRLVIAMDPTFHYFSFTPEIGRKYFSISEQHHIALRKQLELEKVSTFSRFATINPIETPYFREYDTQPDSIKLLDLS